MYNNVTLRDWHINWPRGVLALAWTKMDRRGLGIGIAILGVGIGNGKGITIVNGVKVKV